MSTNMAAVTLVPHATRIRWRHTLLGLIFVVCHITLTSGLTMKPEYASLVMLEGAVLKLECLHQYQENIAPNSLIFKKDGAILTSNLQMRSRSVPGQFNLQTYIYEKNATLSDSGSYECKLDSSGSTTTINVYVIKTPECADVEYVKGQELTLECDLAESDKSLVAYTISWDRNNVTLKEDSKYTMVNNTLQIFSPERADMGEYYPVFTFFPNSNADRQIIKLASVSVLAKAEVDSHDNNKNMVQGDDLELKCKVSGFPKPDLIWKKDTMKVNGTDKRVHLESYEGVENAKLIIYSLEYEDEGVYQCVASNSFEDNMVYNATGEMRLRVKDKLAALWPFLGIVAEVIILCAIILCYEKSRSKKLSDEDDAPDGNVENTADHGDVRHRRT